MPRYANPRANARIARRPAAAWRLDAGLDEFKWFIYRFTSPAMKHLFTNPRNVAGRVGSGGVDARRRRVRRAPGAAAAACACSARSTRADRARHGPRAWRMAASAPGSVEVRAKPCSGKTDDDLCARPRCAGRPRRTRHAGVNGWRARTCSRRWFSDTARPATTRATCGCRCTATGEGLLEVWRTRPVERHAIGDIAWARNGEPSLRRDRGRRGRRRASSPRPSTPIRLTRFIADSPPHLLRIWTTSTRSPRAGGRCRALPAVLRRARARLGAFDARRPCRPRPRSTAATTRARDQDLLARLRPPRHPVENPRRSAPTATRANTAATAELPARCCRRCRQAMPLLLSGTASVVDHRSLHPGDCWRSWTDLRQPTA